MSPAKTELASSWLQFVLMVSILLMLSGDKFASVHAADDTGDNTALQLDSRQWFDSEQLYGYEPFPKGSSPSETTPTSTNTNTNTNSASNPLQVYKQPSSWMIRVLKEMFTDIDWQKIEDARFQIEKFIYRVEQIVGSVRSVFMKNPDSSSSTSGEPRDSSPRPSPTGRWFGGKSGKSDDKTDATHVKEMLERVACFVGYSRLMNLGNEALAELDASKVVTNLFGAASKRNSSGWKWWG